MSVGEGQHFAQPQAQAVGEHQHVPVFPVVGAGQQGAHLHFGQYFRIGQGLLGAGHGVVLPGLAFYLLVVKLDGVVWYVSEIPVPTRAAR